MRIDVRDGVRVVAGATLTFQPSDRPMHQRLIARLQAVAGLSQDERARSTRSASGRSVIGKHSEGGDRALNCVALMSGFHRRKIVRSQPNLSLHVRATSPT